MSSVGPMSAPISFRTPTIELILSRFESASVVHITAPPFSGKSALGVLLGKYLLDRGKNALYFPLAQSLGLDAWISNWSGVSFPDLLAGDKFSLHIFDDAQSKYDDLGSSWFWNAVKTHEGR